ncbi:F-box protein At2g26850-like isoform X2 [Lycium ferocissimum]|uniref:F-box protein At2g26850-like isoform X2 n=1 Tax=Lycium ferocissimum TaxID=112874 RepID=UPI002815E863|nr:F-box protein At2g26850-like isoform X2 [Lycium ferocissimum]
MLFLLISCFSFILLLSKSLLKPILTMGALSNLLFCEEVNLLFCEEVLKFLALWFRKGRNAISLLNLPLMTNHVKSKIENVVEKDDEISLLDLPDLTLECIFERLQPNGLCKMAAICSSLREKCTSDHLWEKHMKQKWGTLIGSAAYKEWQCYITSRNEDLLLENSRKKRDLLGNFSKIRQLLWNRLKENDDNKKVINSSSMSSNMDWYLSLETGKFWFPAQVFNRENGHVGFMLSCYDAEVSYDCSTNTFRARYPAYGRRIIEEEIEWNRLRAPTVDTPSYVLHVSDCLNDLKPDDHFEIQWRKSKEFPYGWWYGVVGHLESCSGSNLNCHCHASETVLLEFKQYTPGSRWRQTVINRKDHREVGNEADGFYGGIRKLYSDKEISLWKSLWPSSTLE